MVWCYGIKFFYELAQQYPQVEADKMLVDAMTVLANGIKTRDLGGESSTVEVTLAVIDAIREKP